MRTISFIIGVLLFIAAVLGGLYVAIWLCLVGGIIQLGGALQHTPVDATQVAYGVVRILCTSVSGALTFMLGAAISGAFISASSTPRRRRW